MRKRLQNSVKVTDHIARFRKRIKKPLPHLRPLRGLARKEKADARPHGTMAGIAWPSIIALCHIMGNAVLNDGHEAVAMLFALVADG